ncbi:MAG: arginine repressor [Propionibacteriaceae bacterium]
MTTHAVAPLTKAARRARIIELLERNEVRSQTELADLLGADGVNVTQGTLSKDLVDLGAVRVRGHGGQLVYAVPGEGGDRSPHAGGYPGFEGRLAKVAAELLITAEASANLVVLRTPPGAAQYFASAIDRSGRPDILGTTAGDDTVLVICRETDGGADLAGYFLDRAVPVKASPTTPTQHPAQPHP